MAHGRLRLRATGVVQGVGFRPFVHRLAGELGLAGWVLNDGEGVLVEAEGGDEQLERLIAALRERPPPLARVESVRAQPLAPTGERGFRIAPSRGGEAATPVAPDAATCDACLAEVFDPADRRHRYPFANCTECGPRFTIVRGVPYDRALTTMAGFEMCARCRAEYEDPADRRFHAEPNACPECGPRALLLGRDGEELVAEEGRDPVAGAAAALLDGAIVAVKGLGGYHLACRADDEPAVAALRGRKRREQKPFALMAAGLDAARRLVEPSAAEEELLASRARPIVLARRREGAAVAPSVAPRSDRLGLMLPYSPLHHLLLADTGGVALVMTSGNRADEPIAYRDADALARLAPIADLFLVHDRPIETRTDDSVFQVARGRPQQLRRSRGHVPDPLPLPVPGERPLLACGAALKNTFCLAKGGRAWLGHHIGDLEDFATLESFREGIAHFERLFEVEPALVAHDLHPDYLSTRYALEREGVETLAVQHHHAHLAACLAEHGRGEAAVGAILDGSGYGGDGTIWGGELLVGDLTGFERVAHLRQVPLPGGDAAVREPWRMAAAWLAAAGEEHAEPPAGLAGAIEPRTWRNVCRLARDPRLSPPTSSAGRLFDAVAALCGVRATVAYEGQAAIELEALADPAERNAYELPTPSAVEVISAMRSKPRPRSGEPLVIDPAPAIRAVAADVEAGVPPSLVSARFHNGLADAIAALCARVAAERDLGTAVLSGGVFQNRRLLERTAADLESAGLEVLTPERVPANDGGIALGQAAIAAALAG